MEPKKNFIRPFEIINKKQTNKKKNTIKTHNTKKNCAYIHIYGLSSGVFINLNKANHG